MATAAPTADQPKPPQPELLVRLRTAAVDYVKAGWTILPVSSTGDRLVAGRGPADPAAAYEWWSERPYGIACRVGDEFDVVQVPVELGELVLGVWRRNHHMMTPPVIEIPAQGHWLFLVTPHSRRILELPARGPVRLLPGDTWIMLPPTPLVGGEVLWVGHRPAIGLAGFDRLPHSLTVQWAVYRALYQHAANVPMSRRVSTPDGTTHPRRIEPQE